MTNQTPATLQWRIGDRIFLQEKGVAEVTGFGRLPKGGSPVVSDDSTAPFLVLKTESGTAFIPQQAARDGLVRPLLSVAKASDLLTRLRDPRPIRFSNRSNLPQTSREVMGKFDPTLSAKFLKGLYGLATPSHQEQMAIGMYETLCLKEVALVLELNLDMLVGELRSLHAPKP